MSARFRPEFPFRDRASYFRALALVVRETGPIRNVGTIRYCDDGRSLVGLPEEIAELPCTSCVLLAVYAATVAHQAGHRVDLCCSAVRRIERGETEHAWIRVDGDLDDPSVRGGALIPPSTYVGAVIVPVE